MTSVNVFDGLEHKGYIRGLRGVHGPIRFRYKAMWPEMRRKYLETVVRLNATQLHQYQSRIVAELMTEWDQRYRDDHPDTSLAGAPMPITEDVMRHQVFDDVVHRIAQIIARVDESDVDPSDPMDEQLATAERAAMSPAEFERLMESEDQERVGNSVAV